jgi:hypothetical protein
VASKQCSVLSQQDFEELARLGHRVHEALRLEFVRGRIVEKPMTDGLHGRIMEWLTRRCLEVQADRWLHSGPPLRAGAHHGDNVIPDGSFADAGAFSGHGGWSDPEPVLMTVAIAGGDSEAAHRSRWQMPRLYAETGIPVHLLIDRDTREVKVHSQPDGERYELLVTVPFGKTVTLPDPVGFDLDTEPLREWVR